MNENFDQKENRKRNKKNKKRNIHKSSKPGGIIVSVQRKKNRNPFIKHNGKYKFLKKNI